MHKIASSNLVPGGLVQKLCCNEHTRHLLCIRNNKYNKADSLIGLDKLNRRVCLLQEQRTRTGEIIGSVRGQT